MVQCCRCNRTGMCKGCSCVKAGNKCSNCLPSKLGNCQNSSPKSASSVDVPVVLHLTDSANLTTQSIPLSPQTLLDLEEGDHISSSGTSYSNSPTPPTTSNEQRSYPMLPNFLPISTPNFTWGIHSATDFTQIIEATYSEVVHWRPNYFTIPLGKVGKEFVRELSRLFLAFATESSMESIALRAATVLPILLLQKPSQRNTSHAWIEG
ncbi:uncharacterized protein LOC135345735 [Halichondria panicea]|uniref:uncharacterized protein LOC135345735 n=1 Tax=Halichondria panicea TaxID=6063 RepID=UPI00312B512A